MIILFSRPLTARYLTVHVSVNEETYTLDAGKNNCIIPNISDGDIVRLTYENRQTMKQNTFAEFQYHTGITLATVQYSRTLSILGAISFVLYTLAVMLWAFFDFLNHLVVSWIALVILLVSITITMCILPLQTKKKMYSVSFYEGKL